MSNAIKSGTLVCAKRKIPGVGIVLERIKDISEYAEFDLVDAFYRIYDENSKSYCFPGKAKGFLYTLRNDMIEGINEVIMKEKAGLELDAIRAFWSYNRSYSYIYNHKSPARVRKPKTDFVLVYWTKPPSDYSDIPSRQLRNKAVWMPTKTIKKL